MDARPWTNAVANKGLNGAGYEGANYLGCEFQFLGTRNPCVWTSPTLRTPFSCVTLTGIPNIHATRDAYLKVRAACTSPDDSHFWSNVEKSNWLDYLRLILSSATLMASKIEVTVLCSILLLLIDLFSLLLST